MAPHGVFCIPWLPNDGESLALAPPTSSPKGRFTLYWGGPEVLWQ